MSLSDELTRNYYRTTAQRGHVPTDAHYARSAPGLLRRLEPWLPEDRDTACLDLGCGCGELIYAIEQRGFRNVSGVDLSPEDLAQGRRFVKGSLIEADVISHLNALPQASVGFITAFNVVEHFPKDKVQLLLIAAARALRPGGSIVMMVPNAMSPFGASTRYWDLTHELAFTPNNFRQIAALTGFDPSPEFRECGPVPHGAVSTIRWGLWQLLRAGIAGWFLIEVGAVRERVYTMDMLVRMRRS